MKPDIKNIIRDLREQKMEEELFQAIQDEHKLALRESLMNVHHKETKQTKQIPQVEQEVEFKEDEFFSVINDRNKLALRDTLTGLHKRKEVRQTTHRIGVFTPRRVQAIAASIIVFLMVGASFLFNIDKPSTNQKLFNQYFTTQSSILTVRSGASADFSPINTGMKYFEQKKYEKALNVFKLEPENMIVKLYSGFSYMELKEYNQAVKEFKEIIAQNDNLFIDQAEWNLALCYLATNETDKAKNLLTSITQSNTIYNIRAQNLLKDMGNN